MPIITVGTGGMYSTLSLAASHITAGDTVQLMPGTYSSAVIYNSNITIEGVGPGVIITGTVAQGKGLLVLTGSNVTVKNITFVGATCSDGNGSGIRFEGTNLTVLNSTFLNNQDGILTTANKNSTITVKNSTFDGNGSIAGAGGAAHAIYAGTAALLDVENSTFTNTQQGHDIKSRALNTVIKDNIIVDGSTGTSSYLIDIPNGGAATITGNLLEKGAHSANYSYAITIGEEGATNPAGPVLIANNTYVNDDKAGFFVNKATGKADFTVTNNTISGQKTTVLNGQLATVSNNPTVSLPFLAAGNDFAGAVALGDAKAGNIKTAGTTDWFAVNLTAGTAYTFDLQGSPSAHGTLANAYLTLRDAAGNEIAHNDDLSGSNKDSQITYTPTSSGIYYLTARSSAANGTGTYQVAMTADTTPPVLMSTSPTDNLTGVSKGANLTLTFSESVKAGSGTFVIHNALTSTTANISASDTSQVSFSGSTVTINPTSDLAGSTNFYVTMDASAVTDLAGNAAAAISAATAFNFTTGTYTTPLGTPQNVTPKRDFNGDGTSDILVRNASTNWVQVWTMKGTTRLSSTSIQAATGTVTMGTGDFNGDGKADILWQNPTTGQLSIWQMNGATLAACTYLSTNPGAAWKVLSTGDFNADGKSDILLQNGSQVAIWLMNGTTQLTGSGSVTTPSPAGFSFVGTGDFSGDGKSDILWQNTSTGQLSVWTMNGTTLTSSAVVSSNPGAGWKAVATGDFDGDGKADILLQNTNGQAAIWLMNGSTELSGGNAGANLGSAWKVTGAYDFNGDGTADILFRNATTGQLAVNLMSGMTVLSGSGVLAANPGAGLYAVAG